MVDAALPPSDQLDFDPLEKHERSRVDVALARIEKQRTEAVAPKQKTKGKKLTKKKDGPPKIPVFLDVKTWRELVQLIPAAPPLVSSAINGIRKRIEGEAGIVKIEASAAGWSALLNYSLNQGVACGICGEITAQVSRGDK